MLALCEYLRDNYSLAAVSTSEVSFYTLLFIFYFILFLMLTSWMVLGFINWLLELITDARVAKF